MQEVTGSSPVPSTTSPQTKRSGDFFRGGGTGLEQHGHAAGGATNTPVGCLLVRGSQRVGMSTKKDAARLIRVGSFCFGGRYGARTAAEATAACGGNREPRLGPRSDFSKPCQGAAEKSANATRTGASRQIPSRFPTRRNVYQERCRPTFGLGTFFVAAVQDSNSSGGDRRIRPAKRNSGHFEVPQKEKIPSCNRLSKPV